MNSYRSVEATPSYREREIEWLFLSYFNNRMTVLLMALQRVRPMAERARLHLALFLEDLEHHFVASDAPRSSRSPLRWLKAFLRVYPKVGTRDLKKAFEMVVRVYALFGLRLQLRLSEGKPEENARLPQGLHLVSKPHAA